MDLYEALNLQQNHENNVNNNLIMNQKIKLPSFAGKDKYKLKLRLATVESCCTLGEVEQHHWKREAANNLDGLAAGWFNSWT